MSTLAILYMLDAIRLEINALGQQGKGQDGTAATLRRKAWEAREKAFKQEEE